MRYKEKEERIIVNRNPTGDEQGWFCILAFVYFFIAFGRYFTVTIPEVYHILCVLSSITISLGMTVCMWLFFIWSGVYECKHAKIKIKENDYF